MGVDIHMHVIREKDFVIKDILHGYRDSTWFDELQLNSSNQDYDEFPVESGIPEIVPDQIADDYKNRNLKIYYGFFHITVKDFLNWCDRVSPWMNAGWATTYQKWLYENKGRYFEDYELPIEKPTKGAADDYHFIEYMNPNNPTFKLYEKILTNRYDIKNTDTIVYYFDR